MKVKILSILLICFLLLGYSIPIANAANNNVTITATLEGKKVGKTYKTIQEALDVCKNGGKVEIRRQWSGRARKRSINLL